MLRHSVWPGASRNQIADALIVYLRCRLRWIGLRGRLASTAGFGRDL